MTEKISPAEAERRKRLKHHATHATAVVNPSGHRGISVEEAKAKRKISVEEAMRRRALRRSRSRKPGRVAKPRPTARRGTWRSNSPTSFARSAFRTGWCAAYSARPPCSRCSATRLVRAYLEHRDDLGIADDQQIVDHVDDITAILFGLTLRAMRDNDHEWVMRFAWFGEIVDEQTHDEPGKPLDG